MTQLILQPASGAAPTRHYRDTVVSPANLERHRDVIPQQLFDDLLTIYPDGMAAVWGATPGPMNVPTWERMREGDIVLFYADRAFFSSHILTLRPAIRLPRLAERLWGRSEDGTTWECVFFLGDRRTENIPYEAVWEMTRFGPRAMLRGLTIVPEERGSDEVIRRFGLERGGGILGHTRETEEVIETRRKRGSRSRGQGFGITPQARRVVELYAMEKARAHYTELGFDVSDVSLSESYDLRCARNGLDELHVEVKGTQTLGEKVLLTKNEVAFMRNAHPRSAIFVLHSITLAGTVENPIPSGGAVREIRPWEIDSEKLEALTYVYTL